MAKPLIIYGASGHAKVVIDTARAMGGFDIIACIDDAPARVGSVHMGVPVLGSIEEVPRWHKATFFIAIGDNAARLRKAELLKLQQVTYATLIHPRAVVAGDVVVGAGCLIAAGAVVQPGVRLGEHVIVNTLAGVDHDCEIGDGAHVAPGAHLAGRVKVGRAAMIGVGASLRDGVTIGAGVRIGAGAVVVRDMPDGVTAYGNPARIVHG